MSKEQQLHELMEKKRLRPNQLTHEEQRLIWRLQRELRSSKRKKKR